MNLYYDPGAFELEPVAEIDYSDGDYCFDLRVVWSHPKSGRLYTARDSGCSCPAPFEDYHSLADLEELALRELEREAQGELRGTQANRTPAEVAHFLRVVREAAASAREVPAPLAPARPAQRYGWLEHLEL